MQIISRAEAKRQGQRYYFTGEACVNGHVSKRRVKNYTCAECEYSVFGKIAVKEGAACVICGDSVLLRGHLTCSSECSEIWKRHKSRRKLISRGIAYSNCATCRCDMEWAAYRHKYCSDECSSAAGGHRPCTFPRCAWCCVCSSVIAWRRKYCDACRPPKNRGSPKPDPYDRIKHLVWWNENRDREIAKKRAKRARIAAAVLVAREMGIIKIKIRRPLTRAWTPRPLSSTIHPWAWSEKTADIWRRVCEANPRTSGESLVLLFQEMRYLETYIFNIDRQEKNALRRNRRKIEGRERQGYKKYLVNKQRNRERDRERAAVYMAFVSSGIIPNQGETA